MKAVVAILSGILLAGCAYEIEGGRYHRVAAADFSEQYRKSQEAVSRHRCSYLGSTTRHDECVEQTVRPYEAYDLAFIKPKNETEAGVYYSPDGSGPFDMGP